MSCGIQGINIEYFYDCRNNCDSLFKIGLTTILVTSNTFWKVFQSFLITLYSKVHNAHLLPHHFLAQFGPSFLEVLSEWLSLIFVYVAYVFLIQQSQPFHSIKSPLTFLFYYLFYSICSIICWSSLFIKNSNGFNCASIFIGSLFLLMLQ